MFNTEGYSLSDIAAVTNEGFNGNGSWWIILLFLFAMGGFGNNGDYGRFATAASQQEILFGQQFQGLDNKIDRLGNGIADATFALNNSIKDGNAGVAGAVVTEGRNLQAQLADCCCTTQRDIDSVRYDMANFASAIQANDAANTQKILDAISGNRIADMQNQINQLQLQAALCGVVRYPSATTYTAGYAPYVNTNNCCGC